MPRGIQSITAWGRRRGRRPLPGAPSPGLGSPLAARPADREGPSPPETPDPGVQRRHRYSIVSARDHLVEPPGLFDDRVPPEIASAAPRFADMVDEGCHDGARSSCPSSDAAAQSDPPDGGEAGQTCDRHRGCADVHARIQDMDEAGVWASLCLPSRVTTFTERLFASSFHPKIGLAIVRAYNDWLYEEWCGPYPDRLVPCGITYLADPGLGAAEIYRNARRGFRAVVLPARPHRRGLPSVFSDHWDPIIDACEDTETVICLRGAEPPALPPDAPSQVLSALVDGYDAPVACAEWLASGLAVRFPAAKFVVSEAGMGWVAMLVDRLAEAARGLGEGGEVVRGGAHLDPVDVLHRNFWFTTTGDPSTIALRSVVGADHIVTGIGFPRAHSTRPDTVAVIARSWGHLPPDELAKLTYANACHLLRWQIPEARPSPR